MAFVFCCQFALLDEVLPARYTLLPSFQRRAGFEGVVNFFSGFSTGLPLDLQLLPPLNGLPRLDTTTNAGVAS